MPSNRVLSELKHNRVPFEAYVGEFYFLQLNNGGCKKNDQLCNKNCDGCKDHIPETEMAVIIKEEKYSILYGPRNEVKRAEKILHNNHYSRGRFKNGLKRKIEEQINIKKRELKCLEDAFAIMQYPNILTP